MLYKHEVSNVFHPKIWLTVPQDCNIFDLQDRIINQLHYTVPPSFDERRRLISSYLITENFLLVLDDLFSFLDLQALGVEFGDGQHSKVLFSTCRKDVIEEMGAEEFIEIQPLSRDEAWMLFARVAFKDNDQVSVDIEECARNIAEECRGLPLTINLVAAAMTGKTGVLEWDNCLSSIKNFDTFFPATHPDCLDAELYAKLRYSYDALPNSQVKRCFLYCAMYKQGEEIDTDTLLQMWIGEGLVKSKQGTYLMDMSIARKYLKLLTDRCLFQREKQRTNVFKQRTIRVHKYIHDMAVYNGQKEEDFLFNQQKFPEVHNENCSRISVATNSMENLRTVQLRYVPNLANLSLEGNRYLKELPSEFLLSLTSLKVLNLSRCTNLTTIPMSIGKLKLRKLILDAKLAPCYPGGEESTIDLDECPICFLFRGLQKTGVKFGLHSKTLKVLWEKT